MSAIPAESVDGFACRNETFISCNFHDATVGRRYCGWFAGCTAALTNVPTPTRGPTPAHGPTQLYTGTPTPAYLCHLLLAVLASDGSSHLHALHGVKLIKVLAKLLQGLKNRVDRKDSNARLCQSCVCADGKCMHICAYPCQSLHDHCNACLEMQQICCAAPAHLLGDGVALGRHVEGLKKKGDVRVCWFCLLVVRTKVVLAGYGSAELIYSE
jgi:hypothetical protein